MIWLTHDFGLDQEGGSLIAPMALAHPLHPIITVRGTGTETCGLDDVFPPDDLCSRPKALCWYIFYSPSPPRMFLSLDLLSDYRIQHGAIGPLYVTSNYSTWIFCRGVAGFATDCPCDVWCRGLTTCLLHVGPPFGNRFLNTSWAASLTYWIVYLHFLYVDICNYICLDTSYHFFAVSLLIKYSLFFQVLLY